MSRHLLAPLLVHLAAAALAGGPVLAQGPAAEAAGGDLDRGRTLYVANCARCHGVRGGGGEGPTLARPDLPRAPDDRALGRIVRQGIPGTGMPGARPMTDSEVRDLVAYVRSLGAVELPAEEVAGDAAQGRRLYETRGGCPACHTVDGKGTALGPDLTEVGARRGPEYLRQSLVRPGAALPRGLTVLGSGFADYLPVRVVTGEGREVVGMRINEDSYTIHLRDRTGALHSFYKPELRALEKRFGESLMPAYGDLFSESELDDLVAYLASLRGTP